MKGENAERIPPAVVGFLGHGTPTVTEALHWSLIKNEQGEILGLDLIAMAIEVGTTTNGRLHE